MDPIVYINSKEAISVSSFLMRMTSTESSQSASWVAITYPIALGLTLPNGHLCEMNVTSGQKR